MSLKFNLRGSFIELTSDRAIRMAAYTSDEWLSNGGSLLGYDLVVSQDVPPIEESYPGGMFGSAFSKKIPVKNKQDPVKRAENIAKHWKKVVSHEYYEQLNHGTNFSNAWDKFQKNKSSVIRKDLVSILVINEFADFRFLIKYKTRTYGARCACAIGSYLATYRI